MNFPYPKVGHSPYAAIVSVARASLSTPPQVVTAARPSAAPTVPAASVKPKPAASVAAKAVTPPPLSAAQRTALDAQRQQQVEAEAKRRKAAEQQAAVRRQAEIAESWREAHARVRDPYGHHAAKENSEEVSKDDPHGWDAISAAIHASRRY
ncbi:hypothetical protein A0J57_18180 [Sphingobium sp. 22B]|uniref:hypothetical protein n=1 Tax=unclassified Sphingobium TaxID=2611147 RepID=UPI0007818597|nr:MULTISPECIES: hypothetical protein [unclassified Sphingobium]KXU29950.1 hypothetical protein AXW74_20440 [Sphingobium sp. AM]KYC30920.1 hypothetical protein A0J57_18180 [Sphingobium sp. 22B]OAP30452.1 hypothetical protein A8O16_18470 [Sphingobium sp. 20006FA]